MLGFTLAEMPTQLPPSSPEYRYLQNRVEGFTPARFDALGDLYHRMRELFETIPDEVLFLGPPAAQFTTHDVFPGSIRGLDISKSPAYGIAVDEGLHHPVSG